MSPEPPGRIVRGRIVFEGVDLLDLPRASMPDIRGRDIAMIFQEPMSSLNPVMTIGDQIGEAILLHETLGREAAPAQGASSFCELVGIPDPAGRVDAYPHQFSGGMRQRVMIAMALACNPKLLIADEPTTALDVTIQAQVLELMKRDPQDATNTAILLISHDLGIIADVCERVIVMYAGPRRRGRRRRLDLSPRRAIPIPAACLQSIPTPQRRPPAPLPDPRLGAAAGHGQGRLSVLLALSRCGSTLRRRDAADVPARRAP